MTRMKAALSIALALTVALSACVDFAEGRRAPYNLCDFSCVQDVYNKYCGGAQCVYSRVNLQQQAALCTRRCVDAIVGKAMHSCLLSEDPFRTDFDKVQTKLASYVYNFCEEVNDPIGAAEAPSVAEPPVVSLPEVGHY